MAGRGAPTFLKRQKEQKRAERANAKRAAQQARRDERAAGVKEPDDSFGDLADLMDDAPAPPEKDEPGSDPA